MQIRLRGLTFSYILISCILWSCFFVYDLKSSIYEYETNILRDMEIIKGSLLDKNVRINDYFNYLNDSYHKYINSNTIDDLIKQNLKLDQKQNLFTTKNFQSIDYGSLTLLGNKIDQNKK